MKKVKTKFHLYVKLISLILLLFLFSLPTYAQTIDLDNNATFAFSGATPLTFSNTSNITLKNNFQTNPIVNLNFTSFTGSPITIVPIADSVQVGTSQQINTIGNYTVDFSMINLNANSFGFSAVPLFGPAVFSLTASSSAAPASSSSGSISSSSSSSGGVSSSSSSSGLISGVGGLNLEGPDKLILQPKGANLVKFQISEASLISKTICQVYTSNDPLLSISPRKFTLSPKKNQQVIKISVPLQFAINLIKTSTSRNVTINVTCEDSASNQVNLSITPP